MKVEKILDELERLTNIQTALYQYHDDKIVFSSGSEELKEQIEVLEKKEMSHVNITRAFPFFELRLGNTIFGRLLFLEDNPVYGREKKENKIVIEQAGMILILLMQREIADNKIRAQYKDEFVQDLLYQNIKSEEEIQNRAKLYNWNFSNGGIVVIVDVDDYKLMYHNKNYNVDMSCVQEEQRKIIFARSKRVMTKRFDKVVYNYLSDQIIFIISVENYNKEQVIRQIIEAGDEIRKTVAEDTDFTVTIGIGRYMGKIVDVHKSYTQAKKSVLIGRAIYKKDKTVAFEQLGVYKLLWAVMNTEEAVELYDEYIGKLVKYDEQFHTQLVQTVEAISKYDWNLMKAAKESYIHYNTIKYRFSKICEILEVNLRSKEEQINMDLSLKLYYLNEEKCEYVKSMS
ncbi:helix-turn-helix domain-containing protein [Roseburia hominis]